MTTTTDELLIRLARLAGSRNATSFFINGVPGSGKTHLLQTLTDRLPEHLPKSMAFGPYHLESASSSVLFAQLLGDLRDACVIDAGNGEIPEAMDVASGLLWLKECQLLDVQKNVVVFVDIGRSGIQEPIDCIGALFSNLRYIEGKWDYSRPRIHFILAGQWNHFALATHFDRIQTSYPYTLAHNYVIWSGISIPETELLIKQQRPGEEMPDYLVTALHEITGGHAGAIIDILSLMQKGPLSLQGMLVATQQAAASGAASAHLVDSWRAISLSARPLFEQLVSRRHLCVGPADVGSEELVVMGIARSEKLAGQSFLALSSWYSELVVRLHAVELGLDVGPAARVRMQSLMPTISSVNIEAYRLINEIENAVRNFVTTLMQERLNTSTDYLKGYAKKSDPRTLQFVDLHERAKQWKEKSRKNGTTLEITPLIAYSSTSDLASLISDMSVVMALPHWGAISKSMVELAPVRDAVMHNQLIGDDALVRLVTLKEAVYSALNATT